MSDTIEAYVGTKLLAATPAEKDGEPGYCVWYPDGYESWSPKETFEACYRKVTPHEALLVQANTELHPKPVVSA